MQHLLSVLMVRSTGLEPVRLPTRPSNVRVCQFRHDRANNGYYTLYAMFCQHQSCKFCSNALYFSGNGRICSRALENLRSLCISGQSFIDGGQGVPSIAASEIDKTSLPSDSGTRRTAKTRIAKAGADARRFAIPIDAASEISIIQEISRRRGDFSPATAFCSPSARHTRSIFGFLPCRPLFHSPSTLSRLPAKTFFFVSSGRSILAKCSIAARISGVWLYGKSRPKISASSPTCQNRS